MNTEITNKSTEAKHVLANRLLKFKGAHRFTDEIVYGTGLFNDGYNLWLCNLEEGKSLSELTSYLIKEDSAELLDDTV